MSVTTEHGSPNASRQLPVRAVGVMAADSDAAWVSCG